jgi:uncharacterized phosphosugar-binding protein
LTAGDAPPPPGAGLAARFFDAAEAALARLRRDAGPEIRAAGEFTADRLAAGGRLHHFDTGHTAREPVRRAGGLVGLHAIEVAWSLSHPVPAGREAKGLIGDYYYDNEAMGRMVAERSHLGSGDVLWLVSNSGKEPFPVALALGAREKGCAVVAVTSLAFSRSLEARHPSGKRLFEVADLVVDTRGPLGDAAVEEPGLGTPICPLSGLLNVAAVWALEAETVEALLRRGIRPAVYRSVNLPDGFAWNDRAEAQCRERGI